MEVTAQSAVGALGRAVPRWMAVLACTGSVAGLLLLAAGADAQAVGPGPTASVSPTQVATGESITVRGSGYPAGSRVNVVVCSFATRVSDERCRDDGGLTAEVSATGSLAASLVVTRPEASCPCVVRITDPAGTVSVTVPFTLDGVAGPDAMAIDQRGDAQVELTSLTLTGGGSWRSWFGLDQSRTAEITVTNTGAVAVDDPPLLVGLRHAGQLTMVSGVPPLGRLTPGSARTVGVPVDLGALAVGDYTVEAQVLGTDQPSGAIAAATMSARPWGVPAALLVVFLTLSALFGLLLRAHRRARSPIPALTVAPLALPAGSPAPSDSEKLLKSGATRVEAPVRVF